MGKQSSPVVEYLTSLKWDGEKRIADVAEEVLGVAVKERRIATAILRRWFISAVARAMKPGCRVDASLILTGAQGVGKSRFFEILGGEWFADNEGKLVHPQWIVHRAELERCSKSTFSLSHDGDRLKRFPRAYVLVGTTNAPLDDRTGTRRLDVIHVRSFGRSLLSLWRNQLWAEAASAYRAGESWSVTP